MRGEKAATGYGGRGRGRSGLNGVTHAGWALIFDREADWSTACKHANRDGAGCSVDVEVAAPTVEVLGKPTHLVWPGDVDIKRKYLPVVAPDLP